MLLPSCFQGAAHRAMERAGGGLFMQRRRVFLVPSDDIRWAAVETTIRAMADVEVVGTVAGGASAIEEIARLRPDAVIVARIVDGEPARAFLADVRRICGPTTRLAILDTDYDPEDVRPFAKIGLAAFYRWANLTGETLDCCLATVIKSPMFAGSPAVMDALVTALDETERRPRGATATEPRDIDLPEELTPRERQLLDAIAQGWSNARIADELCLKNQTVRRYISDLCAKLGVESHYAAIVWAKDHGFGAS